MYEYDEGTSRAERDGGCLRSGPRSAATQYSPHPLTYGLGLEPWLETGAGTGAGTSGATRTEPRDGTRAGPGAAAG